MQCKYCGGEMLGDGYTTPITCENYFDDEILEPDCDPRYCTEEVEES